jgi:hypothetical protein
MGNYEPRKGPRVVPDVAGKDIGGSLRADAERALFRRTDLIAPWTDGEKAEMITSASPEMKAHELMQRRRIREISEANGKLVPEEIFAGAHAESDAVMRHFESGAVRDLDDGKFDFEGYLSPNVLTEFARYMHKHGETAEGRRDSDNWQKGFGQDVLMKSLLRHVMDLWMLHRGYNQERPENDEPVEWSEALGGALFNLMALWHERLQAGEDA